MIHVFAQAGMVQGGWSYVVAAYVATWIFILCYSASLWLRSREQP